MPAASGFVRLSWSVVAFTVVVILSGDIVQATSSGAGCGESWPRCEGSLFPGLADAHTAIEFGHRVATTVLTLAVLALLVASHRRLGPGHPASRSARWATGLLVIEILIGAALVRFGWVEDNASWGRVVADSLHVLNTFLLLGSLALAAHFASGGRAFRIVVGRRRDRALLVAAAAVAAVAVSGALNSLADTLALSEAVDLEATPIAGLLVQIRGVHPALAVTGGALTAWLVVTGARDAAGQQNLALLIAGLVGAQFLVGIANIVMRTPLETQVVHLALAELLWLALVIFSARSLAMQPGTGEAPAAG